MSYVEIKVLIKAAVRRGKFQENQLMHSGDVGDEIWSVCKKVNSDNDAK